MSFPRVFGRGLAVALALAALTLPAFAADALFPKGSRLGVVPPKGLERSAKFPGFEDAANKVAMLLVEMPPQAFADIDSAMNEQSLRQQGMTLEKREPFELPNGKATLVIGRQEVEGLKLRKWLLVASMKDLTALVTVQIPDEAAGAYPDDAVRTALATLEVRDTPIQEQLGMLPFKLDDLAGFRVVRVFAGGTVVLTEGPKDSIDAVEQPHVVVGAAKGGPSQPSDRETFAQQSLASIPGFKDLRVTNSEAMRIGGQHGFEVRVEGKDAKTDTPVTIVQWMRFGTSGYLRLVCISTKESWPQLFPRFRAIRDGIAGN